MTNWKLGFAAAVLIALPLSLQAAPTGDKALDAAIAAPDRDAAARARDGARHPGESLKFWGLKPGMTIVEVSPGGGYWSEILAPYARNTSGRYTAVMGRAGQTLPAKFADKGKYGEIHYAVFGGTLAPAGSADFVMTARNVHNWMGSPGGVEKAMRDFYAALKPGGVLGVEEHRSDPRAMKDGASDGYVSTAYVIAAAQKAGFKLEERSEINANPKDTKDHPFGVWTLPPSRQSAAEGQQPAPGFNRAKYDAIGESDRMTLRFRKPA
jgi:predicted methyltransferase